MKNLLKLIVLLASLNIGAQETDDATDFLTGLIVSNATEVTTATKIPVLDGNLKLNTWISAVNLLDGLVSGSGTENYLAKFTASGTVGDSQIFDNGTNLGIGTATPEAVLDVKRSILSDKVANFGSLTKITDTSFQIGIKEDSPNFEFYKTMNFVAGKSNYEIDLGYDVEFGTPFLISNGITDNSWGETFDSRIMTDFLDPGTGTLVNSWIKLNGFYYQITQVMFSIDRYVFSIQQSQVNPNTGAFPPTGTYDAVRLVPNKYPFYVEDFILAQNVNPEADNPIRLLSITPQEVRFSDQTKVTIEDGVVGIGTATPDASAKLELSSITQGFLPPRMTEAQKNAITSPAEGLRIYQTDGTKGWYGFDGTNWRELGLSKTVAKGEFRSLVDQFANDVTETLIDFEVRIGLQNVEWNNTNKTIKNTSQNDITLHLEPQIGRRSTGLVAEIEIWVDISDDGINWDPLDGYAIFKNITNSTSSVAPLTTVLAPNQYARFGMILDTNVSDTGIISNGQGVTNPGASLSGRVVPSVELNITNN